MSVRLAVPDWESLPDELLSRIFQAVSPINTSFEWQKGMHLVCKSWSRMLLTSPERWSEVFLCYEDNKDPDITPVTVEDVNTAYRALHGLTMHGAHVRKLSLCFISTGPRDPIYCTFQLLWHKLPALTSLIIHASAHNDDQAGVDPELLDESSAIMPFHWLSTLHLATSLTSVDIRLPRSEQGFTSRHALHCLAPLTGLRSLKLTCGKFYQPGLMAALANLTSLSELSLTGVAMAAESLTTDAALPAHLTLSLQSLTYLVSGGVFSPAADLASFSQLTRLKLQVTPWHVHTRMLPSVLPHLTGLRNLSLLYGITGHSRAEHIHALSLLTRLTYLDFSTAQFTEAMLPEEDQEAFDSGIPLVTTLPHLTSLQELSVTLPRFTVTDLSVLTQLTRIILEADIVSQAGQLLSPTVKLLQLQLSAEAPLPHCVLGCASLTRLAVAADSDACFLHPQDLPATLLPRMSHADLVRCEGLTGLPWFLLRAPALTHLCVSWSSDDGQLMNSLLTCMHELSALRVVYVDVGVNPEQEALDVQSLVAVARAVPPRVLLVLAEELEAMLLLADPDLPDNIKFFASERSHGPVGAMLAVMA